MQFIEASGYAFAIMPAAKSLVPESHPQVGGGGWVGGWVVGGERPSQASSAGLCTCSRHAVWHQGFGGWCGKWRWRCGAPRQDARTLSVGGKRYASCTHTAAAVPALTLPLLLLLQYMGTYWGSVSSPCVGEVVESADATIFVG